MKYIEEVCAVLADEAERRYLRSKDALQSLMEQAASSEAPSAKLNEQAGNAHKEYLRASKEYLAIAFKKKFLEQ